MYRDIEISEKLSNTATEYHENSKRSCEYFFLLNKNRKKETKT